VGYLIGVQRQKCHKTKHFFMRLELAPRSSSRKLSSCLYGQKNLNLNEYKPIWHKSHCCGKKWVRMRCATGQSAVGRGGQARVSCGALECVVFETIWAVWIRQYFLCAEGARRGHAARAVRRRSKRGGVVHVVVRKTTGGGWFVWACVIAAYLACFLKRHLALFSDFACPITHRSMADHRIPGITHRFIAKLRRNTAEG
jgi:hypothetical protein